MHYEMTTTRLDGKKNVIRILSTWVGLNLPGRAAQVELMGNIGVLCALH